MISTTPHRCSTYSICDSGVAGFSTTPAILPSSRICERVRCRWIVARGLAMHQQMIGAGLGEIVEVTLGLDDHQMDVDRLCRRLAHRGDNDRADRDVGDKPPIHHVDMDPVGAGPVDRPHLVAEPAEIGRQDRRGDDDRRAMAVRSPSRWGERTPLLWGERAPLPAAAP